MEHKTTASARVIEVIETISLRGSGNDNDPVRTVAQYWKPTTGELLAENDPPQLIAPDIGSLVHSVSIEVQGAKIRKEGRRWILTISKPHLQTEIILPGTAVKALVRDLARLGVARLISA